ncbi:MAG: sigma-70 family RNA polymerase sigma factor [Planctomycetota bacterium]
MNERLHELLVEQWRAHGAYVRSLARSLVATDEVDEVVQETWLASLCKSPRVLHQARAWLAAVARNLAHPSRRAQVRRAQCELAAGENLPSTASLLERFETMQRLEGAVKPLPERDRTLILPRYFADLTPREIARHEQVSSEVVHRRLPRARARADPPKIRLSLEETPGVSGRFSSSAGGPQGHGPIGTSSAIFGFGSGRHAPVTGWGRALLTAWSVDTTA